MERTEEETEAPLRRERRDTMHVSVKKKPFGVTRGGEAVSVYCIRNERLAAEVMEYGAAIRSLPVDHGGV